MAAYLDKLVVFSSAWTEHLQHLCLMLQHLREAGLTVKPSKCQIGMCYLEYRVGNGDIQPETKKIDTVSEFLQLTSEKDVRAFLGLTD